jgi:hypothetical protein
MKTLLRAASGILALLSLLAVGARILAISEPGAATITDVLRLAFLLPVALMFGYMAIKGRMPFMDKPATPPSEKPPQDSP